MSWLPRQIPSVGRSRDNLYSISEISDVRNIIIRFIDADRAAQNDQKLSVLDRTVVEIIDRGLAECDIPAFTFHDRGKKPQILEGYMPQSHGGSTGSGQWKWPCIEETT